MAKLGGVATSFWVFCLVVFVLFCCAPSGTTSSQANSAFREHRAANDDQIVIEEDEVEEIFEEEEEEEDSLGEEEFVHHHHHHHHHHFDEEEEEDEVDEEENEHENEGLRRDEDEDVILSNDFYDEEEFEGFAPPPHSSSSSSSSSSSAAASHSSPSSASSPKEGNKNADPSFTNKAQQQPKSLVVEAGFVVLFLVYAVNFLLGRRHNEGLARRWFEACYDIFQKQFIHLGPLSETQLNEYKANANLYNPANEELLTAKKPRNRTITMEKISQSEFRFRATGRRNCLGMQATLKLIKRQDLVSIAINFVRPQEDTVLLEFPLDASAEPFLLCLVKSSLQKTIISQFTDVPLYAKPLSSLSRQPAGFSVFSDAPDMASSLLGDSQVASALHQCAADLQYIHYTDQNSLSKTYPKIIRVCFKLPSRERMERILPLVQASFAIVDWFSRVQLKNEDRAFQQKLRALASKTLSKAEQEQRKEQQEKEAAEKRESERQRYLKMSPEQQAKYDRKQQKKEQKKRQGKTKMIVIG